MNITDLLLSEEVQYIGRITASSNNGLLVKFCDQDESLYGIYKPENFERPLWDFEPGLYKREYLTYVSSSLLGFNIVPETVIRQDLEFGIGSVQHFLDDVRYYDYFEVLDDEKFHGELLKIAVMDLIINNADRKAGHVLVTEDELVYAIDNGLTFNAVPKLRTVIWEFTDVLLAYEIKTGIEQFIDKFESSASGLISEIEIDVTLKRAKALLSLGRFPNISDENRSYPWPIY